MLYSSIENSKIKDINKLKIKKERDKQGLFLIEGEHLIKEANKYHLLKKVLVDESYTLEEEVDAEVMTCSSKVMKFLSELDTPSKVIGVCKKSLGELKGNRILLLDNIQDPGNLGTIIRSSLAFNVDTIVLSKDTVDLYNPKVVRATQGMLFKQNIIVGDLRECLNTLEDYTKYATKVDGGENLDDIKFEDKVAIVMGNEGNGVSNGVLSLCDKYLYIKMNSSVESLNVAVAASIILYELDK